VVENETAYRQAVDGAGNRDLLRQTFVERAGHCTFTPAEIRALFGKLVARLDTGRWPDLGHLWRARKAIHRPIDEERERWRRARGLRALAVSAFTLESASRMFCGRSLRHSSGSRPRCTARETTASSRHW